jgi:hypothetical protein
MSDCAEVTRRFSSVSWAQTAATRDPQGHRFAQDQSAIIEQHRKKHAENTRLLTEVPCVLACE